MLRVFRIKGDSLYPEYRNGDYVITARSTLAFKRLKLGNIIAFKHPQYGMLIKQVTHIDRETGMLEVQGTILESIDSRSFGPIPMHSVLGRMIWHIKAPREPAP
jgi:signal peptidase I